MDWALDDVLLWWSIAYTTAIDSMKYIFIIYIVMCLIFCSNLLYFHVLCILISIFEWNLFILIFYTPYMRDMHIISDLILNLLCSYKPLLSNNNCWISKWKILFKFQDDIPLKMLFFPEKKWNQLIIRLAFTTFNATNFYMNEFIWKSWARDTHQACKRSHLLYE